MCRNAESTRNTMALIRGVCGNERCSGLLCGENAVDEEGQLLKDEVHSLCVSRYLLLAAMQSKGKKTK